MSLIALPTSVSSRKWLIWPIAAGVALAIVLAVWLATQLGAGSDEVRPGMFYTVVPMNLDVTIAKDGELQAVNNIDIVNHVEGLSNIQHVVNEGATVKKGEVLCTIDSSNIKQKLDTNTLELQKAQSDLTAAGEAKEIQKSTNAANLEEANVNLLLAQLDLQEYTDGSYPQDVAEAERTLEMAKTTLKNKEEDLSQTRNLFSKGFVTAADVKKSELDMQTAQNDVEKKATELMVLTKYTHAKDLADKKNKLAQAEQKLVRTERENASNLAQKVADELAKTQALNLRQQMQNHLSEQLAYCEVKAPADGLVIYGSSGERYVPPEQRIQDGTAVREQQLLLRLPDTTSMKAVLRIQEAQVSKLRVDSNNPMRATVKLTGYPKSIGASLTKISVLADSSQRWWNPDLKEYPVDLTLDETPPALKPGTSAQAEIFIDRLNNVTTVPLSAIYAVGSDKYVFIRTGAVGEETRPTKVKIGQANVTHVEILDGIRQGQEVLILQSGQGRELLEKAGIKVEPATRPSTDAPSRRRAAGEKKA